MNEQIKDIGMRLRTLREDMEISAEDMAAFKNEDGSKKYIYVGGNSEITLVNDSASNIINLVFREAEKYRYSVVAKNGDGEMMQTLTNGQDFEGETVAVESEIGAGFVEEEVPEDAGADAFDFGDFGFDDSDEFDD